MVKCSFMDHFGKLSKWDKVEETLDYIVIKCPKCGETEKIRLTKGLNIAAEQATAIVEGKDGKQYAINNKGKIIPNKYENDPRGWKRAGKKISQIDSHNRKVIY